MKINIAFLGTPPFVLPIKDALAKHFSLIDPLKEADLAVVAAYGRIITPEELKTPKYGFINVHPSLLPKYRGPSPIQEAILKGDKTSGITIIKMDANIDHGPILYQEPIDLSERDTFDTLSKKMFLRASEVLPKIIDDYIQGRIILKEQNHSKATFSKMLTRESGFFDIEKPSSDEKLDQMIRAYYPWPGVWTKWKNKVVKFLPFSHPRSSRGSIKNNSELDSRLHGNDKFLIQMEGKKVLPLKDFLNGYPDFPIKS